MTVDVLELQVIQDPKSGRLVKEWTLIKTVPCYAQTIESNKASDTEAGQKLRRTYTKHEIVSVKLSDDIDDRSRLTNFKTRSGAVIWKESEQIDPAPTVFEINSVEPILDMFGDIVEYQIQANRVEVQNGS